MMPEQVAAGLVVAVIALGVTVWAWLVDLRGSHGYTWERAKRRLRRGGLDEPRPKP